MADGFRHRPRIGRFSSSRFRLNGVDNPRTGLPDGRNRQMATRRGVVMALTPQSYCPVIRTSGLFFGLNRFRIGMPR